MANSGNKSTPTMSLDSMEQKGKNIAESNASIIQCPISQQCRSTLDGPVSILWDIENCPVPSDVRPEDVAGNIRMALQVHPVITGAVMMFSAYGDFNAFPRRLREGCQRTGVKLIDVPNGRKDAADKAILVDMFLFALDNPPPSSIMLISGDVDFAPALHILGQRGYTIILVIPAGVGVSSALCNAGKFVWDWPVVARGEGFVPPSKALAPPRGGSIELSGYLMGCHINDSTDGQNEEEAIVYRGMSQSYYNSREYSVVSQSLSEYNSPHVSYLPTSLRSYSLPSGLNDVAGGPVPSSDNTECQIWVQPGDLNGLKGQIIRLLELSGGCLPLVRVPAEYQKIFGKPLFISEYGAFKLVDLFKKMGDAISVEGKGARRLVYLRNRKGGSGAPPLSLAKKDKKGKRALEENANVVIGGCSSDELSDEERVVIEEREERSFNGKCNKGRAARCEIDGRVLEQFKCELQEILVSYSCWIRLSCFEAVYQMANQVAPSPESVSVNETENGAATSSETDQSQKAEPVSNAEDNGNRPYSGNIIELLNKAGNTLEGTDAELVLNPLRLAVETKNLKILEPALDCIHKLIAYDHLEGDPGLEGGKNVPLFTDILNMVCSCIDNSSPDSTILQVLKVLLTAVASSKFRVHGEPLLAVIRVCYNIALNSKSPINQATSKAMLTQMISIVFRRMETDPVETSSVSGGNTITKAASAENLNTKPDETSAGDSNEKDMTLGDALSQAKDASLTSLEEIQSLAGGADIKGLEAVLDKAVHTEDGKKITRGIDLESMSVAQRDALLVFRTLCKMGMKEDNDEVTTKTRILSLELLQGLLEGVSHSFTKNFHFIDSVKAYLSYALLRASVSQSPVIFQYATGIFLVLLLRFRESLKGEIGIFFPLIVLRPLDGLEFSVNQKLSVLRMLEKVCKDPQMLVDIFVNYDCDLEAPNLFERMVTTLSKIAQGTQNTDPNSVAASQTASIKGSSLQGLVSVLKSLVDWEQSHRELVKLKNNKQEGVSGEDSFEIRSREDTTSDFEKAKAHKSTLEAAIAEFNRKPMKGVEYLISNKLVENKPASVAQFLKNTPTLDKATIGDYLGQHEDFPLAVMHAYVDSMKFSGMKFDTAIREFLKGFRLPGEAQKIDRIMEKFAERYCADNPGLFKNADTAYVLAYAVIMLNTDAHNPMVWPKMSKSDFVRMNAKDDPDECAPKELLEEIYDSIVKEEIKMKDDPSFIGKSSKQKSEGEEGRLVSILNLALPKRKSSEDAKSESEAIIKKTQAIFRNKEVKRGVFYTAQQIELVRPMVDAVGWPLLATFSVTMEEGDNKPRVILLMEGFKAGIHITYVLGMDTMRYAFLTSLVRFTFLHAPKEMRSKNVEALRTLLILCDSDMNSLQDTWNAVLECVSRLEFITTTPAISATVMYGSNQISKDAVVLSLRELSGKPAEQVFMNSVKLPSDSIVEFFTALCGVSAEELKQTPARVFSLQKLVEISYYNMARIRMVWARIWSVLANHFISAGSHQDEKIAMYAIDSLRQLGMKYLERAELANFTFQNDILKPFVVLMRNSQSESKRRLIVDCIVQMIKSKVGNIKSGWRSVFMIFTAAADDELESIVESAFENVEQVILEHFDQVVGDCFMDCVNCLIRFANNKTSHRISLKAIALLRICEDRLAEGLIPGGALMPVDANLDATLDVTEHYWFPMLAGLSDLTSDQRPEVRSCALEVLFDLLNERGSKFSTTFWESIFHRVLFPIFDHVRHAGKEGFVSSDDHWFRETSIHSLQLLCNLFNTFYKEVCFMLPPLLSLLLDCAKKTDQTVVSISLGALVHLIEVGGHQFSDSDWDMLLKSIRDASYTTQPLELLNALSFENVRNHGGIVRDSEANAGDSVTIKSIDNEAVGDHQLDASSNGRLSPLASSNANADGVEDSVSQTNGDQSEVPSPSGRTPKAADGGGLQRSQTLGQRIMDNIFLRNLTSKSKSPVSDASQPSSPVRVADTVEPDTKDEESPLLVTVRGKCITQLLLLGAIDGIQKKYWTMFKAPQKIAIMDILLSLLEFAASYNSSINLRTRMHQIPDERPPINLLRQELAGTGVYLDILQKATYGFEANKEKSPESDKLQHADSTADSDSSITQHSDDEEKFERVAEEKLVSFCEQVLREASDLQSSTGETTNMDIHRVLELRAPIIIKVLQSMCFMNNKIFRRHLREFYPLLTRLVCCDQMDVRGALGDLFQAQLKALLP